MDEPPLPQSNERRLISRDGVDGDMMDSRENGDSFGPAIRPVFIGNLRSECTTEDIEDIFHRPILGHYAPIPVERIDLKRGFCFVFLKDAKTHGEKDLAERYASEIHGMRVNKVSDSLRVEFARGDGRVKRKEDERRKRIIPSDTLFVVNFQEATTKREDLEMLFSPFGEIIRIDMKKNYAFVQFTTIDSATRAKDATNGGKLDQSVITVEYVAQHNDRNDRGGRNDRDRDDRRRDNGGNFSYSGRSSDREASYRGSGGGGGGSSGRDYTRGTSGTGGYRERDDDLRRRDDDPRRRDDDYRRRDERNDDGHYRSRDRSPPPKDRYDERRERYDDHRGHTRSRSRSPVYRYRSRSPPVYRYRSRTPSPDRRDREDHRVTSGGRHDDIRSRDSGSRFRASERDYRTSAEHRGYK